MPGNKSLATPANGEAEAGQGRINILNVGTKILVKDTMDQYIRTLGDFKTFYAPSMQSALRTFQANTIHILITEVELTDGSAHRLVQTLGGATENDDLYIVLALEENSRAMQAIAEELEVHSVVVKPFTAANIKAEIERYNAWREMPKDPWKLLIFEAELARRDKRFVEAEDLYRQAVEAAPENPMPAYKAGLYFLNKPEPGMAEKFFHKALEMRPDHVQSLSALGQLYLNQRRLDQAEAMLKKAQDLAPLNPDRALDVARLHFERAIEATRKSMRYDPQNTAARAMLGKFLAVQREYVAAVQELELAMPALKDTRKTEAQTFVALARKLGGIAK